MCYFDPPFKFDVPQLWKQAVIMAACQPLASWEYLSVVLTDDINLTAYHM
jgi:hypothetical protein